MPKFSCHVVIRRDLDIFEFAPGDEVPSWAIGNVGAHVLTDDTPIDAPDSTESTADDSPSDQNEAPTNEETEADPQAEEGDSAEPADAVPDFTQPAPAKRGRPRKQA